MGWSTEKLSETAQSLINARLSGAPRKSFPGDIPADLETAYAVQARAIEAWPDKLSGFKVGGIPASLRDKYPADWLAGPIFEKNTYSYKTGSTLDFPMFEDGFVAFEPELIFEINSFEYSSQKIWTPERAKSIIKRVWLGAEIAASPNLNVNNLGPGSIISDFGNNGGCILGREVDLNEALSTETETIIDGKSVGKAVPGSPPGGPIGALTFLLNHLGSHAGMYNLPDTLLVSSGAITGVHQSQAGALGEIIYAGLEKIDIRLVPKSHVEKNA
jgi:2-keto-4-pentenoate hydratase